MSRRPLLAVLAIAALLLSGCSLVPSHTVVDADSAADGVIPAARFGEDVRAGLEKYYRQILQWRHCAPSTQCAEFSAPLDWWHARGGSIHLFVARHRATGNRIGSLVVDPGGPGASGANAVAGGVDGLVSADIAKRYDVIGVDPRGVGYSSAVDCGGTARLDALFYSPTPGSIGSSSWIATTTTRSKAFAAACRGHSGELLDHIDSLSAARDLELLRRVLREPKLDYLDYSYGTALGELYAGMFPSRVGRFVLDGVDDPWYSGSEDASQAKGFETALDSYLRSCVRDEKDAVGDGSCPFSGTRAAVSRAVSALLAAAHRHPLVAKDGRKLTDAVLATAISEALYNPTEWPQLTRALAGVGRGSAAGAMALADEYWGRGKKGYYDNQNEAFLAISCLDGGSDVDLTADAKELRGLKKDDPVLGAYAGYGDLQCAGWDVGPAPLPAPVRARGAGPILVVGTTRDPATPYPQAKSVAKRLESGNLVTFVGDGHTAYDYGNSCVDGTVDAYLLRGTVPARDPRCS